MVSKLELLQTSAYRTLWCSSLAGAGAQWMERVVSSWLALQIGGDAWAVGLILSLRLLPFLLFGLVAGTIADRFSRRTVLMVQAGVAALTATAMAGLSALHDIQLWQLAVVGLVLGTCQVFDMTSRGAFVVDLVGRSNAAPAIALNAVALRLCSGIGALIGGASVPALGASGSYVIVAGAYLIGLLLLSTIRVPPREVIHTGSTVPFRSALASTAWLVLKNPALRMVVIASMVAEIFGYSHQAALPSLARDVLMTGPQGLGALSAASSAGATITLIALASVPGVVRRQPLLSGVLLTWGLALFALGSSSTLLLSLAIMLVVGGCAASVDVLQQTIAQSAVPENQRGRANGIWVFSIGLNVVGLFQVGLVANALGAGTSLAANGVLAVLLALLIVSLAPAYRWRRAPA